MLLFFLLACQCPLQAQEVLLPLQWRPSTAALQAKNGTTAVTLPFFDDFSARSGAPSPTLWQAGGALAGPGYGTLPPTVGMVSLDPLDANGRLYPQASTSAFGADTLESLPIRLDGLRPSDSVVLSFYYLPGGGYGNLWERIGDTPGENDSLYLEFYHPQDSSWQPVWSTGGMSVDTLLARTGLRWQYVAIAITDSAYLDSTFRFRFRNLCSIENTNKPGLAGNCDQWNLDYILLDRSRSSAATPAFRDVTFASEAPSMLQGYQAVPARQYSADMMKDTLRMAIASLYNSALATHYRYAVVNTLGDTIYLYNGGYENAPPFLPNGTLQTAQAHASPIVEFAFPTLYDTTTFTVVHTVREGAAGDIHPENDTVRFHQVFGNYYAYDDGTAENGYGITSSSSKIFMAVRFDLAVEDTLTALDLYFNRTLNGDNEHIYFRLCAWADENGHPGTLLYRDGNSRTAQIDGLNRFHRYLLDEGVSVSGSIFVGLEQQGNHYLNLGFDRHTNSTDRIYYLTSTTWQQSILSGSLMLRPCFGVAATVGIEEWKVESGKWRIGPNPASDFVQVDGLTAGSLIQLYDMQGRTVTTLRTGAESIRMDTERLPAGVYLMRVTYQDGQSRNHKIIIQH